jgi:hypothetical protein
MKRHTTHSWPSTISCGGGHKGSISDVVRSCGVLAQIPPEDQSHESKANAEGKEDPEEGHWLRSCLGLAGLGGPSPLFCKQGVQLCRDGCTGVRGLAVHKGADVPLGGFDALGNLGLLEPKVHEFGECLFPKHAAYCHANISMSIGMRYHTATI